MPFSRTVYLTLAATAALFLGTAQAWSRFNVGNKSPPITCGGAPMSEQIAANVRGENPDVPVSMYARYPMLEPFVWWLSRIHSISATVVLIVCYIQLCRPKKTRGTASHMMIGRILSFNMFHYFPIAYVLNYKAIMINNEDWKLAPPASDWRAQISYIVPFALNTTVAAIIAFARGRYEMFTGPTINFLLKAMSLFSIGFWFTIGLYQVVSQAFSLGLGGFGYDVPSNGEAQEFFRDLNILLLAIGTAQAGFDYINYKLVSVTEYDTVAEASDVIVWKNQHKWAVTNFSFQCISIFAIFLAYFPYCLYGFPEWTCISHPVMSSVFLVPMMVPFFYSGLPMWAMGWMTSELFSAETQAKAAKAGKAE